MGKNVTIKENNLSTMAVNGVIKTSTTGGGAIGGGASGAAVGFAIFGPPGAAVGFLLGLATGTKASYELGKNLMV